MKMKMKKIVLALTLLSLSLPVLALGAGYIKVSEVPNDVNIPGVINRIIDWGFAILLLLASVFVMWAGYLYLSAAGKPDNVAKAKDFIIYAVIAVVVAFLAKTVPNIIKVILGISS